MTDDQRRFSHLVEQYFERRGTFPMLLSYRSHTVSDGTLDALQNDLFQTFNDLDGVEVICTEQVHGEYWAGVLIELSDRTHTDDATPHPHSGGEPRFDALSNSCISPARDLYTDYLPENHRPGTGVSAGSSVYAAASLEALGREYFRREREPDIR